MDDGWLGAGVEWQSWLNLAPGHIRGPESLGLGLWGADAEVTQGMDRAGLVLASMPVTLGLGPPGLRSTHPAGKLGAIGVVPGCRAQGPDAWEAQTGAVP